MSGLSDMFGAWPCVPDQPRPSCLFLDSPWFLINSLSGEQTNISYFQRLHEKMGRSITGRKLLGAFPSSTSSKRAAGLRCSCSSGTAAAENEILLTQMHEIYRRGFEIHKNNNEPYPTADEIGARSAMRRALVCHWVPALGRDNMGDLM
jgi:hypothetical protein